MYVLAATAAATAVLSLLVLRRRLRLCGGIVTFTLALLAGNAHWSEQSFCISAIEAASQRSAKDSLELPLMVVLDVPLKRDGYAKGVARGTGELKRCKVKASVRAKGGGAPAGAELHVTGSVRSTRTLLAINGVVTPTKKSPELLKSWRSKAGSEIDKLFPQRAALVRALLIADQDDIDAELRDMYAQSGLVHLLSVSGLHVAIIAEALKTMALALRLSRTSASVVSLAAVAIYVLLLGAPPSAVRSAVMMATISLSELQQRPIHSWTALALGAWIPTFDPSVVVNLGWQLSVAGMASLVAARELLRRLRRFERSQQLPRFMNGALCALRDYEGIRRIVVREVVTGIIATAATAPIIAWTFGRLSIVAPLSNIVAGPIVAILQPALFLALLLAPFPSLAQIAASSASLFLDLLHAVARVSAAVPYAAVSVAPGLIGALLSGLASLLFIRATASQHMMPTMITAVAAMTLAFWSPFFIQSSRYFELHMIDVGQGDAIALRTPRGRWVLMDAGRSWNGGDAGRRTVVPYVKRRGGDVAAFILSHAHDDHVGGAPAVIEALRPERWFEPVFISTTPSYVKALAAVQEFGIPWRRVHPGDFLTIDDVVIRILGPDSAWTAEQSNVNEASVVAMAEYKGVRFLLTGDAEANAEKWMVDKWGQALDADVLKLGHHGSKTSSSAEFVNIVTPQLALASVGAANRYGHPSPETLARMYEHNVPVLRTDTEGHVIVRTDGRTIQVSTRAERWTIPVGIR